MYSGTQMKGPVVVLGCSRAVGLSAASAGVDAALVGILLVVIVRSLLGEAVGAARALLPLWSRVRMDRSHEGVDPVPFTICQKLRFEWEDGTLTPFVG